MANRLSLPGAFSYAWLDNLFTYHITTSDAASLTRTLCGRALKGNATVLVGREQFSNEVCKVCAKALAKQASAPESEATNE